MKKKSCVLLSLFMACFLLFNLFSCSTKINAYDLMKGIKAKEVQTVSLNDEFIRSQNNFSIELFKKSYLTNRSQNTLISPLSVYLALAMTANGADGQTLEEMQRVLGGNLTLEQININLVNYVKSLPNDDKQKLKIANSIWFKDDPLLTVEQAFLQTNADYYGASAYKAPFNNQTVKDINNWVKNKTERTIDKAIENISKDAVMYLVNALLFEGEWTAIYEHDEVKKEKFTSIHGEERDVKMMLSNESFFVKTNNATGVIKRYKGNAYSFVALLPNEGIEFDSFINSLSPEEVYNAVSGYSSARVITKIPKFSYEYNINLKEVLSDMGMPSAFLVENADFSRLGSYEPKEEWNIYVMNVIHRTSISVAERGTKAGAVTVIEMGKDTTSGPDETKYVYLNRPFVYMIINNQTSLPIFMGCVTDIN